MSDTTPLNRRQFLERAAILGALSFGAASLFLACDQQAANGNGQASAPPPTQQPQAAADFSCNNPENIAGLSDPEKETRSVNEYVDKTPNPEQRCDNCGLWQDPQPGEDCGGCTVVAGPIHPAGWCRIWVPAS